MTGSLNEKAGVKGDPFRIRPAGAGDVRAMAHLLQELFIVEDEFDVDVDKQRTGLKRLLESPSAGVWVAERRGRVVGMVTVQLVISTAEGGLSGLLEDLVVSSAHRRQDIGKALLRTAVRWTRKQGATRIQLLADGRNVPALIFYRKREWKQTNMIALRRTL